MEKVRKISKRYYVRQIVACWLVLWMGFGLPLRVAMADTSPGFDAVPGPGNLTSTVGIVGITDTAANWLEVTQTDQEAIMNWNNFDIGENSAVEFIQPGVTAAVLNRVNDAGGTGIMGALTANGRVFIINPAGIIFGSSSSVNVAQLVASSLGITDGDFLDGLPYTFTGGATAGNVQNGSPTTIDAERIYLIGKQVINRGALVADDYVVMAAGETVTISESSAVVVEVSMPDDTPGDYDYVVDHGGAEGTGPGSISADHVILAAGDIWSTAITGVETLRAEAKGNAFFKGEISAYSDGGSDAVATIEIIADGDVTIDNSIYAEAYQDSGNSEENAFALIDVKAGRDIEFKDYGGGDYGGSDLGAYAETSNGSGDATAVTNINAGRDVLLNARIKSKVEAYDSGDATTQITITGRNITTNDRIISRIRNDGSGDSTGTIDIIARGDVVINGDDDWDYGVNNKIESNSDAGNATANTTITGQNITITDAAVVSRAKASTDDDSGDATANVNVEAAGNLDITTTDGYNYGAWVKSHATTENDSGNATAATTIKGVDITIVGHRSGNDDGSVVAKASADDSGSATANLNVNAGNVTVDDEGYIYADAYAYNHSGDASATVDIDAVGSDVTVNDESYIYAEAYTYDYAGNATALVDIDAGVDTGGNVTVNDSGNLYAEAYGSGNVGDASATVDIDAGGNVTVDEYGYIYADAYTYDESGGVTALVDIDVGGDVTVVSEFGWGEIYAYAYNDDYSGDASATVDIDAVGSDVTVNDEGYIYAYAEAQNYAGNATALVDIDAGVDTGGNVTVNDSGNLYAEAYGSGNVGDASATVDIDAGGNVTVDEYGYIYADADAYDHSGNATALVDIDASGDVTVNDGELYADAETGSYSGDASATVDIDADNVTLNDGGYMYADAEAQNYSGNATALVDIDTVDSDVTINDNGYIYAYAYEWGNAGDASATVDIDADNVTVDEYGYIYAEADAYDNSGNATALVDIDAGGDVTVVSEGNSGEGEIYADAETGSYSGDASATVDIDADNVTLNDDGYMYADAYTYDNSGNATALVDIDTVDSDVTVNDGELYADAETGSSSGDASATVDIDADNVTLNDDSYIYAQADTYDGSGDTTATTEITTTGSEVLVENNSYIYSSAYSDETGDATARTTVTADDITVRDESDIYAEAYAYYHSSDATATVDITTTGSEVLVENDSEIYSYAQTEDDAGDATAQTTVNAGDVTVTQSYLFAEAYTNSGSGDATATVDIDATGEVVVDGDGESSYVYTNADAENSGDATAQTTVDAADVTAIDDTQIYADAYADDSGDATATTDVTTTSSEVLVDDYSYIWSYAETEYGSGDATARTTVIAGDVTVDNSGEIYADAYVYYGSGDATATVDITTTGSDVLVENNSSIGAYADTEYGSGDAKAAVAVDTGGVTVSEDSEIKADAYAEYGSGDAEADVQIAACGDVIVNGYVETYAEVSEEVGTPDTAANVTIHAYGDVVVNSEDGSNGRIEALASDGEENSAAVTILAVGDVIVNDGSDQGNQDDSPEEITAVAQNGSTNNAFLGIATREGFGGNVEVSGQISARARNMGPGSEQTNTSNVEICADQDLIVYGGFADIEYYVPGAGPIQYDIEGEEGGQIMARASGSGLPHLGEPVSFNTANVDIYAGRDVIVHGADLELTEVDDPIISPSDDYFDGGRIYAATLKPLSSNSENTTHVGIYAQRDVTINDATITGEPPEWPPYEIDGWVWSGAHGDYSINNAEIEICALDDVTIDGRVLADAGTGFAGDHDAHIRIRAGDEIAGSGEIEADADDSGGATADASITFYITDPDLILFDGITIPEADEITVGPVECPDCEFEWIDWSWCEDCEEVIPPIDPPSITWVVPPFDQPVEFGPAGRSLLMTWLADELGVGEDIQVVVANAYAYSTDFQPYDAAARLQEAARILADEDGSYMAAMLAVFNELAPADAPFTPEMGTAIATAFSGAAEGSQYASVAEYIDAFVRYVAILDTELGSPVEDSVAFVMEKYGTGITESENSNLAAFVAARLEAGETFAP